VLHLPKDFGLNHGSHRLPQVFDRFAWMLPERPAFDFLHGAFALQDGLQLFVPPRNFLSQEKNLGFQGCHCCAGHRGKAAVVGDHFAAGLNGYVALAGLFLDAGGWVGVHKITSCSGHRSKERGGTMSLQHNNRVRNTIVCALRTSMRVSPVTAMCALICLMSLSMSDPMVLTRALSTGRRSMSAVMSPTSASVFSSLGTGDDSVARSFPWRVLKPTAFYLHRTFPENFSGPPPSTLTRDTSGFRPLIVPPHALGLWGECVHHVSNSPGHPHVHYSVVAVVQWRDMAMCHYKARCTSHKYCSTNRCIRLRNRKVPLRKPFCFKWPYPCFKAQSVPNTCTTHSHHQNSITSACTVSQIVQAIHMCSVVATAQGRCNNPSLLALLCVCQIAACWRAIWITPSSCLVLSCFFRVHPLGGLFLAHAEAGLHCTVQSITPPWAGCSGLMHLNHLKLKLMPSPKPPRRCSFFVFLSFFLFFLIRKGCFLIASGM